MSPLSTLTLRAHLHIKFVRPNPKAHTRTRERISSLLFGLVPANMQTARNLTTFLSEKALCRHCKCYTKRVWVCPMCYCAMVRHEHAPHSVVFLVSRTLLVDWLIILLGYRPSTRHSRFLREPSSVAGRRFERTDAASRDLCVSLLQSSMLTTQPSEHMASAST